MEEQEEEEEEEEDEEEEEEVGPVDISGLRCSCLSGTRTPHARRRRGRDGGVAMAA